MAKIIRSKKIVEFKFNDLTFKIKPLTQAQKVEVIEELSKHQEGSGEYIKAVIESGMLILKKTLKELTGVTDQDDEPWELEFDDNGEVTEECMGELATLEESGTMLTAAMAFFQKYPKDGVILNPETGDPIEGLSIVKKKKADHETL